MKPKISKLRKASKAKQKQVDNAQDDLLTLAGKLQNELSSFVFSVVMPSLDIRDGMIVNSTKNLRRINNSTRLKSFLKNTINKKLAALYVNSFKSLNESVSGYYGNYDSLTKSMREQILNRANLGAEGFIETLFDNNEVQKQIQDTLRGAVSSSLSVEDIQATLKAQIEGTEEKMGTLESFHYSNGRDEFQRYTRGLDEQFSQRLNLNYAIYQGGEITTTRQFCEERNNKVFNRETIAEWQNEDFQGKMKGHDIFVDAGGYNCRHNYDWISFEMAKRLDPEIEKSKFDK